MARRPRIHAPGALYHVMLRGNGGEDLFFSERDRLAFEALVGEGVKRYGHFIHAYCWMTNHAHFAIQVGATPLSKIIHNLAFRHALRINKRRRRLGHVFQGRYKALLVDKDRYLLALVRYIHRNPLEAGLAIRPEDYPWSSHRAYLGLTKVKWLTTSFVLRCFGGNDEVGDRERYRAFVDQAAVKGGEPGEDRFEAVMPAIEELATGPIE